MSKFPEGWTIETTWDVDWCGPCDGPIEDCRLETCPILQVVFESGPVSPLPSKQTKE